MLSFPQRLVRKGPFFPFPFDGGASFFFRWCSGFFCELGAGEEICVVGGVVVLLLVTVACWRCCCLCPRYEYDPVTLAFGMVTKRL